MNRLREVPWEALEADAVAPAVAAVLAGATAEKEVERVLRAHRRFSREQRRAAVEAIFGVALWRRRLAWQASGSDIPEVLLACLIRDLAGAPLPESLRAKAPPRREGEPARLADRWSLPNWLEVVLEREFGNEADAFCAAIAVPG